MDALPQLSLSLVMEGVLGGQWQPQLSAKRPVVGRHARTFTLTFFFPMCVSLKENLNLTSPRVKDKLQIRCSVR